MRKLIAVIIVLGLLAGGLFWLASSVPAEPEREEVRIELPDTFEK